MGDVVSLSKRYPRRLTLEMTTEMHDQLKGARADDGIAVNTRIRALIAYWQAHPEMQGEVRDIALRSLAAEEGNDVA